MASRITRFEEILKSAEFGGMIFNAGPTLTYLTGLNFHLMERPVVLFYRTGKRPVLVLPELEAAKVEEREDCDTFFYGENPQDWPTVFASAIRHIGGAAEKWGVEPLRLRYFEYSLIASAAQLTMVDGSSVVARMRAVKEFEELEKMRKAVQIAQDALRSTLPLIRIGMDELEIAGELVVQLLRNGSSPSLPFNPIVSAGPNGANPHAAPSQRKLSNGDLLVIDWGANHEGYLSDLTRTFGIGDIDEESNKIHDLVQQANDAGRAAGGVGILSSEVDRAARRVIEAGGYGQYFTHRTGHGIGLQCHEEPYMHGESTTVLQHGMTYTVEPGIYLPGKNGVRIEDDVYVSEEGVVSLSDFPRRLMRLC